MNLRANQKGVDPVRLTVTVDLVGPNPDFVPGFPVANTKTYTDVVEVAFTDGWLVVLFDRHPTQALPAYRVAAVSVTGDAAVSR